MGRTVKEKSERSAIKVSKSKVAVVGLWRDALFDFFVGAALNKLQVLV